MELHIENGEVFVDVKRIDKLLGMDCFLGL